MDALLTLLDLLTTNPGYAMTAGAVAGAAGYMVTSYVNGDYRS